MGLAASRPTDPAVTPKVIVAGFSNTGTLSLAEALQKLLDGTVLHTGSALYGREDEYARQWVRILKARKDREKLLKLLREATVGYVAVADSPAALFVPELLELYPDAKVVLTDTDSSQWWESMQPVLKYEQGLWMTRIMLWVCFTWRHYPDLAEVRNALLKEQLGGMNKETKDKHNARIREVVPKKQLLQMRVEDGWGPLCSFLKKPVPSKPFPKEDEVAAFNEAVGTVRQMAMVTWAMYIVGYGAGIIGLLWWLAATGRI
ncbi:hypothetical protein LIA77_09951 [Sarocladium implicatum]|nr:hypothetical protein LIA77_09951 [Sarocladium implicatum]